MGRTIAIANQKGGVGKTTTAINLSACLAEAGQHVLLIDFDPQGNATSGVGLIKDYLDMTAFELLVEGDTSIQDYITKEIQPNLDVLPSDVDLAGAEFELRDVLQKEMLLKKKLELVKDQYDYILIDCPPALGMLTIMALTAADTVLVPIQCEFYALEGMSQMMKTIEMVQAKLNPYLVMEGVVFTMYDARTNLSADVVDNVKRTLSGRIYKTIIQRNIKLAEAPSHGLPITLYDSRSSGAENYRMLAAEVISRGGF
ncbi:MAG: AAA family ATPase [Lachnospiraceae bacterium]|jgi:chromosome partitioning protein|nr:AAA family ATPase [Lachnospiraceae bacterium]